MTAALWVEQSVTWQWWIGTLLLLAIGAGLGYWFRGVVDAEREHDEYEEARRAARVYQREIDRARRRHPSAR